MELVTRYIAFAVFATILNIGVQFCVMQKLDWEHKLYVAMLLGTLIGLVTKYVLDKKYIFFDYSTGNGQNIYMFAKYSVVGVFTTLLFWFTELAFDAIWTHGLAKYIGAAFGLSIGYSVKYQIDKRFVFSTNKLNLASAQQND